jgi:predicted ATPase/class 3 adenylate cyclase
MESRREDPPTGTVTFLFSDIEGSTKLVERFGAEWPALLERHRAALRGAFREHGGWEHGTEGDSFFVVFASAPEAVAAAAAGQRALEAAEWPADGRIRVRMGLHSGEGRLSGDDYVGIDVHRAARIAAAAHGGQVLISESTAALIGSSLPDGVQLLDLGSHRLKDMPRPERLRQLAIDGLQSEFPPLRSLGGRTTNLPVALSSLVGREADMKAVRELLRGTRLVTVTGPGGTGKTRLVQEVARLTADEFSGGSAFVPLETIRDADLIPVEILRALRFDTATSTLPRDRVVEVLSEREWLLVLDNLEQLAGAAALIRDLLSACEGLKILASSQAPLRVGGEREYALQPLPDGDSLRLFVDRAQGVRPDFQLDDDGRAAVAAIVDRLDGLPLAIELAAAQVRMLTPAAILARIGDRIDALASRQEDLPERQRTLRSTVTWSYDLLPEPEQQLFRRMSVFVGGATLEDVEGLEERAARSADVLATLEGLVERSLVVRRESTDDDRFAMLEPIRSVGRALLRDAHEEGAALDDHAAVFRDLARRAEPELYGTSRRAWLDRLAAEHGNLRAALDHLAATGDVGAALDIASNVWRFWQTRGHLAEGRARIGALLAAAADRTDLPPELLSRAEEAAGSIAYWTRVVAFDEIEPHYRRALELARESGDRDRQAWSLYNLAFVYDFMAVSAGRPTEAARAHTLRTEALDLFRAVGDQRGIGESLWALGGGPINIREQPDISRQQLSEAARLLEEAGDSYGASWALISLGMLETSVGRLDAGRDRILAAAELFLRDDDLAGQIICIQTLGAVAAQAGDDATAARLGAAAEALARKIGVNPPRIPPVAEPIEAALERLTQEQIERETEVARSIEARPFLEAALAERNWARSRVAKTP